MNPITYTQRYKFPEPLPTSNEMVISVSGGVPGAKYLVHTVGAMLTNIVAVRTMATTTIADIANRSRGESFRQQLRDAATNWLMNFPDTGHVDEVLIARLGDADEAWHDAYIKAVWEVADRGSSPPPADFPPRPADYIRPTVLVSGPGSVVTSQPTEDKGTLLAGVIGPKKAFTEDGFDFYPAGVAAADNGVWKYKDGDKLTIGGKLYVASLQARPFPYLYFATASA